jgi:hypothetical protein
MLDHAAKATDHGADHRTTKWHDKDGRDGRRENEKWKEQTDKSTG